MKRFLIDGLLILLLVGIGSSMMKEDVQTVDQKIDEFDEKMLLDPKKDFEPVREVKLNKASQFAKDSGVLIEEIIGVGVEFVASIFHALVE